MGFGRPSDALCYIDWCVCVLGQQVSTQDASILCDASVISRIVESSGFSTRQLFERPARALRGGAGSSPAKPVSHCQMFDFYCIIIVVFS